MNEGRTRDLSDWTLAFDGQCRLCLRSVEWIRVRLGPGAPTFVDARDPGLDGLPAEARPQVRPEDLLEEMHLFGPEGEVFRGSRAVEEVLRRTPRWRWLGSLLSLPPIRPLARRVYQWVADHRTELGCGDHCSLSEPKGKGSGNRPGSDVAPPGGSGSEQP